MSRILNFMFFMGAVFLMAICANAKDIKITVTPSDAKVFIDGNYFGDEIVSASFTRKDEFLVLKFEREEYVTLETKIYKKDKRKAVSYIMKRDMFYESSDESSNANRFFFSKDIQ